VCWTARPVTLTTAAELLMTQRRLLRAGVAGGGAAVLAGAVYGVSRLLGGSQLPFLASWRQTAGAHGTVRRFYSAPELEPATTYVLASDTRPSRGSYLFMGPAGLGGAQSGPMIVDNAGEPVWFQRAAGGSWLTNFGVHTYRGEPVLVWWEGRVLTGYGFGEAVILDRAYREIARVKAANGHHIDLHELTLTDRGTALLTCPPVTAPRDRSAIGGSSRATVRESLFQEVNIATGQLVRG
jgi:Arylsulfotransferase (ASST)